MFCHRVVTAECQNCSLVNIRIRHQVTVYKKALISITRPDPFITFYSVNKENAAAKPEGMLCYRPDLI